jgi:hypothetical protein
MENCASPDSVELVIAFSVMLSRIAPPDDSEEFVVYYSVTDPVWIL